jgi:hypothetical protein
MPFHALMARQHDPKIGPRRSFDKRIFPVLFIDKMG